MQSLTKKPEVLLVIMPWDLPKSFVQNLDAIRPRIEVISYKCGMYDTEVPVEISHETWSRVTVLFTWRSFPSKEQASNLEYVQLLSAGCNHAMGKPIFEDTDISFCTANGVHPPQIAEWVISTFLAFQHHPYKPEVYDHWENQKREVWVEPISDEDTEDAVDLRMGVLGYGSIGRQCARLADALGMDVHAFTLHERSTPESRRDDSYTEAGLGDQNGDIPSRWFYGHDQLNDFLGGLDLLVITLPLTPLTEGMISREQFQILGKRKAFVCNAARGPIIVTNDLVTALNAGTIKGAAVDVIDPEPLPPGHLLWKAKNVIITPHVSGNSTHYNERAVRILAENLGRRAEDRKLMNQVNRSLGY
ncbi:Fc.00g034580.m01.CDS01 [Cosmosporella sp. VM-42]